MKKQLLFCVAIFCNVLGTVAQCVTPSLSGASSGGAICTGNTLSLFANGPANVTAYSWAGPNSFSSTLQNPSISGAGTTASGIYTVTVINGVGTCSATYTVPATINAAPVSAYVFNQNPVCKGSPAVISPATAWCNPFTIGCNGVNSIASTASIVSTAIDNLTIEAWVLWNGGSNQTILANGNAGSNGYALQIVDGAGTLQITLGGVGYMTSTAQLTLGIRQHVAIVRSSGIWSLYVNGTSYPLTNAASTPGTPGTGFFIGNNSSGSSTFSGYIGNVGFWTVARSTAQIQADINTCSQSPATGLAGYWLLGEGSGTSAADGSGNGNTLTLQHTTWRSTLVSSAYTWNFGDGVTSAGSAPAHTYTASGTYTVSVSSSACSGTASKVVTVNAFPSAGIISGSPFICAGASATLSTTATGGVWSSGTSSVAAVSSAGNVTGVAAGTATISYSVTNACGTAVTTKVATVNALPVAGVISGPHTVCTGAAITLSDTAPGGTWSSGNTAVATIGTGGVVTGMGAGTTTISYTATTGLCTQSATTVVSVSAAAAAGTIQGMPGICVGASTFLFDTVSNGVWSSSNAAVANVDVAGNVTAMAAGTATISYSVTTCNTAIAAKTVTVNALPVVTFTSQAVPPLCTNTAVTYATQTGAFSYQWTVDGAAGVDYTILSGGTGSTDSTVTLQWNIPGNLSASVRYLDVNACSSTITNTTTISSAPVTMYNVAPAVACTGTPISFIPKEGAWCNSLIANVDHGGDFEAQYINIIDNLTIEAWVQPQGAWYYSNGHVYGMSLFSNGDNSPTSYGGYGLYIDQDGFLKIEMPNSARCKSSATIPFDQKSHVAIVRNAGVWSIYVNGVQYSVTNDHATPFYSSFTSMRLTLGGVGPSENQIPSFNCQELISNVSFWSIPRTTAQIQSDMNSCSLSPQSGLEAYWPLDGDLSDHSGNGHDPVFSYGIDYVATNAASYYLWDFGDGSMTVGGSPWHAYTDPGVYTVNISSTLCPGTSSVSVTILDTLAAAGTITGTTSLCPGITTILTDLVPSGTWSTSAPAIATIDGSGHLTTTASGTATISYSVSNACGVAAATTIVTVTTAPAATFAAAPPATYCRNTPATYTTQAGQTNYIWSIPGTAGVDYTIIAGSAGTTSNSVTLTWLSSGYKTVTVNYTSAGCGSIAPASAVTNIDPVPVYAVSPDPICVGNPATFTSSHSCNSSLLNFNGNNSTASWSAPISTATDNITIEAWVRWDGGGNQTIFVNGNIGNSGYGLNVTDASGHLMVLLGGVAFASSAATLTAGANTHVALVRNAGTWSIYLNGAPYSISSPTTAPNTPNTGFFVGSNNGGSSPFNGMISNVQFWTIARSTAQIQADMATCGLSITAGLAGYWQLNDGYFTLGIDASGNGHNLTLSNTTWVAAPSYMWSFGDGSTSTLFSAAKTYTTSGTYTVSITATNTAGCSTTASQIVTVNAVPVAGTITGILTACTGITTALANPTGMAGGVWSSGAPGIAGIGSATGIVTGAATGTAIITYAFSNSCGSVSAAATVTINVLTPSVFTATPPTTLCKGTPATYTALAGQTGYVWTVAGIPGTDYTITAGGTGAASNTVTLNWLTPGAKTVTVNYTGTNGCAALVAASNTISVNVSPVAAFSVTPTPLCIGDAATFLASASCRPLILNFNGSNSSASYGTPVSTAIDNITMEAWVQWNGGANQMIFLNGDPGFSGYGLQVFNTSGQMQILMGGVSFATSSASLTAGVPAYVAIVRNSGTWSIYVNGTPYSISTPTATPTIPGGGFFVGNNNSGTNSFNGAIRNVSFWNAARSSTQLLADMSSCTMSPQSGLVGYWPLGEGYGTTAADISGSGHNLALTNTSWAIHDSSYTWSYGDGATGALLSASHTYTATGTYSPSLTVTNNLGCISTATAIMTVNPTPVIGGITGSLGLCRASTTALSDTTTGGTWTSGNLSVATVGTNGVVIGLTSGTAIISYTARPGCFVTTTATVTVIETTPVLTATLSAPICPNGSGTYTALSGQSNYIWTLPGVPGTDYTITGGGTGLSSNSVTVSWLSSGNKTVTVNYTGTNGCAGAAAATTTTTVNAVPAPTYTVTPNPVCIASPVPFMSNTSCSPVVLNFNGSTSRATFGAPISAITDNVTIEAWVQWNGGANEVIFLNGNAGNSGYGLHIFNTSGQLQIIMGGVVYATSAATLTAGVSAYVAIVRNSGTWSIYVNNVAYPISSPTATPNTPGTGFYAGAANDGTNVFNGIISNISFWTMARSTSQMQADMNSCTLNPQAGLAGYWQLGEGTGTIGIDASGNAHNLSLINTTWIATPASYLNGSFQAYAWSFGDGATSTLINPAHTYTAAGTYTSSLIAVNAMGCSGTATSVVTVNAVPSISAITGATTVCQAASTALSDATAGGSWTSTDLSVASVSTGGSVTGIATGTANISYTLNNGCVAAATAVVTVNSTTPSFTASPSGSNCINIPLTYTTQSAQTSYIWNVPGVPGTDYTITAGGTGSSSSSVTLSWLTLGNKTVTAAYTSPGGCAAVAPATSTTTIGNTYPVVSYSVSPAPSCAGTATTLIPPPSGWCYSSALSLTDGFNYLQSGSTITNAAAFTFEAWVQWQGGAGPQGIYAYGTAGGYTYGLTVAADGHLGVAVYNTTGYHILTSSAVLSVGTRTHVALRYSAGTWAIVVNGVANSVSSSATPVTTAATLAVGYDNLNNPFNGLISNMAYWRVGRTSPQIIADMNSCSLAPATSLSGYWSLNEGTGYTAADISGNAKTLYYTAGSGNIWTSTSSAIAYTWSFGDGYTSTAVTPSHIYSVAGVYSSSVVVTGVSGCSTMATNPVTVNVAPALASATAGLACTGGTLGLFANTPSAVTGYLWSGPNAFSATDQNPVISGVTSAAIGTYTVNVYNVADGCSASYTATATVNGLPVLTGTSAPSQACVGGTLSLSAGTPSNITGYSWSGPGSFTATTANPTITGLGTEASGIYTVIANNGTGSGCAVPFTTGLVQVITVPVIGPVSGATAVCLGGQSLLSDTTTNGFWFSGDETIATITNGGLVTGVSNGVVSINYAAYNICGINERFVMVTVNGAPAAISGPGAICAGSSATLTDAVADGVWSSGAPGIASISSSSGLVTGIAAGTAIISYAPGAGCLATFVVTVSVSSGAGSITGPATVCAGSSTGLSDAVAGGAWSSGNTAIATVSSTGMVSGVAAGTATITYAVSSSCGVVSATAIVTVSAASGISSITGLATVCAGGTTALTNATAGGTWSSSSPAVGSVDTAGNVTGITAGTATISYSVANSCGIVSAVDVVIVNSLPDAGSISGPSAICVGGSASLTDAAGSGIWSSATPAVGTVDASGNVTGITPGTTIISYSVTSGCGTATATVITTVNTSPGAGTISGPSSVCTGNTIALSNAIGGGTWSSGAIAIAAVDASGHVTGVTSGVVTISYSVTGSCGASFATAVVSVNTLPVVGSISGTATVCQGSSAALTDATAGGAWSSGNPSVATVGLSGVVNGISAGTSVISYVSTNACGSASAVQTVTINAFTAGTVTGPASVSVGGDITLTDAVTGGTWSASNGNATVAGGAVHGVAAGTVTISYAVSGSCGTAVATKIVSVGSSTTTFTVAAITGFYFYLCAGSSATFFDATAGGAWSINAADAAVASVSPTGVVSGLSAGTARLSYAVGTSYVSTMVTVYPTPAAISGYSSMCVGITRVLSDATPGGVWSSTIPATATIGSGSGLVNAVNPGTVTVYYTIVAPAGCRSAAIVTVNPSPAGIAGAASVCAGSSVSLTDVTTGGLWSSAGGGIAVDGSGGVTGVSMGTATVTYTLPTGCYKTYNVTVKTPPAAISGNRSICGVGGVSFLSDATAGISWTISPVTTATVSASGRVYGVSAGTATLTYNAANGCIATAVVTVNTLVTLPAIAGPSSVGHGAVITLSDAMPGGIWSSSNTALASVGATGEVTGIGTSGTVTITYAVVYGSGCTASATKTVTVHTHAPLAHGTSVSGAMSLAVGAVASIGEGAVSGMWTSSNTNVATVDGGIVTAVAPGITNITHTVTISDSEVVTSVTPVVVSIATGDVRVIPNPNAGAFTIKGTLALAADQEVTLEVTDVLGQVIYQSNVTALGGRINQSILLSGVLPNGMYMLNMHTNHESKVFHFVIEK